MTTEEWLGKGNQIGIDIWEKKYRYNNETFDEWLDRVSGGDAEVRRLIEEKKFLFGGRILAGRGVYAKAGDKLCYSNCFVAAPPDDNIESIFETAKKMARTYSYGGGIGVDISKLAPAGAKVHNAAKESSGAVSFMDLYSTVTGLIGQAGRRGALMISMSCDHPDIEQFIDVKKDLNRVTKANISVRATDEFMDAAVNNEPFELSFTREETGETISRTVNARDILIKLAQNNWEMGEPGVLFWDRIEEWNMLDGYDDFEFAGVNPCFTGDMRLLTEYGYRTFEELAGHEVRICNRDGHLVFSKVRYSGVKSTVIVKLGDKDIICTPDHIFLTADGEECKAEDLKGKRLMPYLDAAVADKVDVRNAPFNYVYDVLPGEPQKVYDFSEPETHWGVVEGYVVHNCAEEPLGAWSSCLLGSINLSEFVKTTGSKPEFDFDDFTKTVRIAVRALNDVLDEGMDLLPLPEQKEAAQQWRQIGLGIFGLADMLIKLGIRYGSKEATGLCDRIGYRMIRTAFDASCEDGRCFPRFDDRKTHNSLFAENNDLGVDADLDWVDIPHMANSQLLTIAPTGTLSTMLGVSGGIEPIFANSYERRTESLHGKEVYYKVYTPIVKEYMDAHGITDEADLPDYFVTAHDIDWHERIAMQAAWQQHIDASISSTINLPHDATPEDIFNIYVEAWQAGLKGVTVFRDGCSRQAILSEHPEHSEPEQPKGRDAIPWGTVIEVNDDVIGKKRKLMTGCGSLHCVALFDPVNGNLLETYLSKGSNGGCQNFMIGLSRMISLAARAGVGIDNIIDQLESCGVCPSYAVRHATKHDTSSGSCCPVAVGRALKEMWEEMQADIGNTVQSEEEEPVQEQPDDSPRCPDCGAPLVFEGGCNICKNCGWSKCS